MKKFPIFANRMLFYVSGPADIYKIVFVISLDVCHFHCFIKNKPCPDELKPFKERVEFFHILCRHTYSHRHARRHLKTILFFSLQPDSHAAHLNMLTAISSALVPKQSSLVHFLFYHQKL